MTVSYFFSTRIVYAAISYELIHTYVESALKVGKVPEYLDFCDWEKSHAAQNMTFKLATDFCFTTMHSLQLYRSGVRVCNDHVAQAARERMAALFYITNSPKYQELIAYDTLYLLSLEDTDRVRVGMDSSRQGTAPYGEGWDFLMETRNKLYKSFLTNDAHPSFEYIIIIIINGTNVSLAHTLLYNHIIFIFVGAG